MRIVDVTSPGTVKRVQSALPTCDWAAAQYGGNAPPRPASGLQREAVQVHLTRLRSLLGRQTTQRPGLCVPTCPTACPIASCHNLERVDVACVGSLRGAIRGRPVSRSPCLPPDGSREGRGLRKI